MGLYEETFTKFQKNCRIPCNSIFTFASLNVQEDLLCAPNCTKAIVKMSFKNFVKVSRSMETYSALSLIAEVGGYVGLFLGISVNQISNVFKILMSKINKY